MVQINTVCKCRACLRSKVPCSVWLCVEAGRKPSFVLSPKDLEMSVAEADEEAIKWFLIAAKWGLAEGMNSLARKLWADNGLKTDQHVAWETEEVDEQC